MSNLKTVRYQETLPRGQMTAFVLFALGKVSMGLTRFELLEHSDRPFNKAYFKAGYYGHGFTTHLDSSLRALVKSGKIRIAGFRSGQKNGQGAAIYQIA